MVVFLLIYYSSSSGDILIICISENSSLFHCLLLNNQLFCNWIVCFVIPDWIFKMSRFSMLFKNIVSSQLLVFYRHTETKFYFSNESRFVLKKLSLNSNMNFWNVNIKHTLISFFFPSDKFRIEKPQNELILKSLFIVYPLME